MLMFVAPYIHLNFQCFIGSRDCTFGFWADRPAERSSSSGPRTHKGLIEGEDEQEVCIHCIGSRSVVTYDLSRISLRRGEALSNTVRWPETE